MLWRQLFSSVELLRTSCQPHLPRVGWLKRVASRDLRSVSLSYHTLLHLSWFGVQRRIDCPQTASGLHDSPHPLPQCRHEWRIVLFDSFHGVAKHPCNVVNASASTQPNQRQRYREIYADVRGALPHAPLTPELLRTVVAVAVVRQCSDSKGRARVAEDCAARIRLPAQTKAPCVPAGQPICVVFT